MAFADEAHHFIFKQLSTVQLFTGFGPVTNHHIDQTLPKVMGITGLRRQGVHFDTTLRRQRFEARHHRRQKQRVQRIAGGNAKHFLGLCRVERFVGHEQLFGRLQNLRHRLQHLECSISGHHARACSHQNGVAREFAQTTQGRRHRWLLLAKAEGGFGNTAFDEQGMKRPYELEVNLVEKMRWLHIEFPIGGMSRRP